jgi:hypothetical protein
MAVALDNSFFKTLPDLPEVEEKDADMAWFIYDLIHNQTGNIYCLKKVKTKYTNFKKSLDKITTPSPGKIEFFINVLQSKLDEKLDDNPPENHIITDILNI